MIILSNWLIFTSFLSGVLSLSCGIDNSLEKHVSEGVARIETYPWLGVLYYPHEQKRLTTAVVLVTRQLVVATALEIDKLPKNDFRDRARVVIGHNCSAGSGIGIRDYSYHPDYTSNTFSALVLIQLETDHVKIELRPICPPPETLEFQNQTFFAMVLSENCDRSAIRLHKMMFVSTEECKTYYRRTELGFGVYGPGCQAPARFLDYGMYHEWVQRSVERIGRPAITKLASNYIVLRRSLANIQRFGPCDAGEVVKELYTELVEVRRFTDPVAMLPIGKYNLNLTIIGDAEYSCVVLRADYNDKITNEKPTLRLRRYCASEEQTNLCYSGVQFIQINFHVEITFTVGLKYSVTAYGRKVTAIDSLKAHKYANRIMNMYPPIPLFNQLQPTKIYFQNLMKDAKYRWYNKKEMKSRNVTGMPVKLVRRQLIFDH